jgi:exopolysaccharide production protein ExoQ
MSAVPSSVPSARPAVATLWHAALVVLASVPFAMAIAHRSAPLVIVLATVIALAAAVGERRFGALLRNVIAILTTPLGIASLAFLLFAALSIAWSPDPKHSLAAFIELIVPISGVLALALLLPERRPHWAFWLLAVMTIAACVLTFEVWTGMAVRRGIGARWNSFVYNRPALTVLVLAPPLLWGLLGEGRRRLAAAAAVLIAAAALQSDSGAAAFGLAVAILAYLVARWRRAVALAVATGSIVGAIVLAPLAGEMMQRAIPAAWHEGLRGSNSQARVDIWRSFGAAVREQPWLGAGFSPGAAFAQSTGAKRVDPGFTMLLAVGHPHNGALQIWTELGVVGAFLALVVLGLVLRLLATLPDEIFAPGLALLAAAVSVSLVGHGLWQGWWAAAIGAAIVWFRIGPADEGEGAA